MKALKTIMLTAGIALLIGCASRPYRIPTASVGSSDNSDTVETVGFGGTQGSSGAPGSNSGGP
jgi:hypothetical protein